MLWTIAIVLLGIWLIGQLIGLVGTLLQLALVVGLAVLVVKLVQSGSRSRR